MKLLKYLWKILTFKNKKSEEDIGQNPPGPRVPPPTR